jgi:penicillin-binding protein 1C
VGSTATWSLRAGAKPATHARLLSPEASYLVLDMLRTNPRPGDDGRIASARRSGVAWKTGTSFGFRDAWAVGVGGRFALGVWVGNFDGTPNPAFIGREAAGPLFFRIVDALRRAASRSPSRRRRRASCRRRCARCRARRPATTAPATRTRG